jgi:hypothetical protein
MPLYKTLQHLLNVLVQIGNKVENFFYYFNVFFIFIFLFYLFIIYLFVLISINVFIFIFISIFLFFIYYLLISNRYERFASRNEIAEVKKFQPSTPSHISRNALFVSD